MLTRARMNSETLNTSASFSTDTTHHEITVPAGKKYLINTVTIDNDVNGTIAVKIHDVAGNVAQTLISEGATVAMKAWPQNSARDAESPVILAAGESLRFVWGAAQSTGVLVVTRWEELSL